MKTYNQSLIKAGACPLRFKRIVDAGNVKRGSQHGVTNIGSAVHEFAVAYYEHCWREGLQTDLSALGKLCEEVTVGSGLRDEEIAEFRFIAQTFVDTEIVTDENRTMLEETIEDASGQFFGTLDRQVWNDDEHEVEIADYKTWRKIRTLAECKSDVQLPFYAGMIASKRPDIEVFKLVYKHVRFGIDVEWQIGSDEALAMLEKMRKRVAKLEALTEYPPKAGSHCDWCEYAVDCPLVEEGAVQVITGPEMAQSVASKLYASEVAVKNMKARLKAWVDKQGPVDTGDVRLDYNASSTLEFDVRNVAAFCKTKEVQIAKLLAACSTNQTQLRKLAKSLGWDKERTGELIALGAPRTGQRFGFKKVSREAVQ